MSKSAFATKPMDTAGMPPGVPFIIGNELAERFSFYGMKTILTVFMTKHLLDASGGPANMSEGDAKAVFHLFTAAAYFFPMLGALVADIFLGKYKTILYLSLMYCVGHGCLAVMDIAPRLNTDMAPWLYAGLFFIAIGAGAIKPCVSANVGDQFGERNKHLISKVFSWFYFSINVGAATSSILTPVFLAKVGPWLAFGVPGVLMAIATFIFWLGRRKFVHVPPAGIERFKRETLSDDGVRAVFNLAPIFLIFIPVFWAIFDQTGSAWVLQAEAMDRRFLGIHWLESQVQAVNPILILILIPTFAYGVYPALDKVWKMTPLRKIGIGLFITAGAFTISALIEHRIEARAGEVAAQLWALAGQEGALDYRGLKAAIKAAEGAGVEKAQIHQALSVMPNIGWQFVAYLVITAAEVMVSITSLEFAYTQAPKKMKSFIMGVYFLGVSLGNLFTSAVNRIIQNHDGTSKLEGASYYWFFTILMLVAAVAFIFVALRYKGRTYLQSDEPDAAINRERAKAEGTGQATI